MKFRIAFLVWFVLILGIIVSPIGGMHASDFTMLMTGMGVFLVTYVLGLMAFYEWTT